MLEDMDDHEESSNQAGMEDKSSSLTILTASNTPAMRAARELRGKQETLDKQIEIDLASNEARAQRVADLLAKFKTESAQAIEAMADDHDLKIEVYEYSKNVVYSFLLSYPFIPLPFIPTHPLAPTHPHTNTLSSTPSHTNTPSFTPSDNTHHLLPHPRTPTPSDNTLSLTL